MLETTKGRCESNNLPQFKKSFTPITSFMKNLKDTKVTKDFGGNGKYLATRPNLNVN